MREHRVDELVVAVDDPRLAHRRHVPAQPLRHVVDPRDVPRPVLRELPEPSVDLPVQVPLGPPEPGEPARLPVHTRERRQPVDHLEPELPPRVRVVVERRGQRILRHKPVHELHHVEPRPDHVLVLAQRERLGVRHVRSLQRREHPVLAHHVVCRRRHRHPWRPPQHPVRVAPPQLEDQVRGADRDRLRDQRSLTQPAVVEPEREPFEVEDVRGWSQLHRAAPRTASARPRGASGCARSGTARAMVRAS